jgi:thiamine biosynthesis lipoprotein
LKAKIPQGLTPLQFKGTRVRKTGPWTLDLGGIAKGYAVDRAVQRIRRRADGTAGLVNAGGDLRAWSRTKITMAARTGSFPQSACLFDMGPSAAATSSVRIETASHATLAAAAHVRMPEGKLLKQEKTVTVFADRCLVADALTKVVLLARPEVVARCLSRYRAKALVFSPDGRLERVFG